ncbi:MULTISPECIES: LuxR C-terminal-related transcriptional regulator [Lentzea]|uniref:Homeodomain-like domain-containing protein n=1 Tax=Lentzea jiangxiensis TaxID=641025 RepID=A0A1H0J9A3_9PSEU|nr:MULTISPECIES: LuxR C-terminal-related transcriptional regulator [Lentzea]MCG8927103.1 LuxR C-terminal-related transcriptional regulator [Lentzea sp. CC55]WVH81814.1 LuxR C-terminal-related transcriptional regulator [Lentzea sp. DG1S-22]SDO40182.1 Homeodomain-like domain-containing protein [Lentzea jiangxiensis]
MTVTRATPGVAAHPAGRTRALVAAVGKEPTTATQHLLGLMRTGATDRAIARELDVSLRTLNRRISRLQSLLGVQSRFQLGVLAAELDWLSAVPPRAVGE